MKPAKHWPISDKIKWDGLASSFKKFRKEVEGYLLQVGAGYITDDAFMEVCTKLGMEYLRSGEFWQLYQKSIPQAYSDGQQLYGLLMNATAAFENKIIIKYHSSKDGILAWHEFIKEYGYEGSKDLKIEFLESIANKPYTSNTPGGLGAYIDQF